MITCFDSRTTRRLIVVALMTLALLGSQRLTAADNPSVFSPGKVWQVHITLSSAEYEAIEPRGNRGFGMQPKAAAKPIDPNREVHRNAFGADLLGAPELLRSAIKLSIRLGFAIRATVRSVTPLALLRSRLKSASTGLVGWTVRRFEND